MSQPYRVEPNTWGGIGGFCVVGPNCENRHIFPTKGMAEGRARILNEGYTAGLAARREGDAKVLERGWRTFWDAFADYLRLGYEQRTYGWHDIIDAETKGIAAVNRLATDSVLQREAEASRHSLPATSESAALRKDTVGDTEGA